ncbi:hypothetical protein Btru_012128 [Bulinus truncatus]|nr:hypothetical protein Btru_012128 [Bulinus truncatus]
MATMASTSHRLAAWTNTCIKAPVNHKTGLNVTLHDKKTNLVSFDESEDKILKTKLSESTVGRNIYGDVNTDEFQDVPQIRSQSVPTKEDFYIKLQLLKEENKKTLDACKKLYQEKVLIEGIRNSESFDFYQDKSGIDRNTNDPFLSVTGIIKSSTPGNTIYESKPPMGKSRGALSDHPHLSKTLPQKSASDMRKKRPNSAPRERLSHSFDDLEWSSLFNKSDEKNYDDNFVISSNKDQALEKVKQLWEDFKISDSPPRRHSFSSSKPKQSNGANEKKEWRHRITIPQPFTMSLREALKEKKKTKAQLELEQRRLEKQKQEEAECEKKFKAQPIPAHVYLPKYEEIMEKNESRRQCIKHYCKELLESQVKPFHFEIREKEKKMQRTLSAPVNHSQEIKQSFKAKPVPKHIFSPEIDEKFLEEEELRKIRVRMRAKELLHEASLPPSMAEREKLKEQEKQEMVKHAKLSNKKKQIRYAHSVPDYDALYKEFQKELSRRKAIKEGTVVEPFNLETERIHSHRERIKQDTVEDEKRLKENNHPFQRSRSTPRSSLKYLGALSNSLDSIPALSSKAADLRAIRAKKEQDRINNRFLKEEESQKRRKARESKLRRYLKEKANVDDIPNPRDSIAERLKKRRLEDRIRQEAYQREIEEMKQKIEQSPLLVEKYMTEKAKKEAENKFSKTIKNAGLDEKKLSFFNESSSLNQMLDSSFNDTSDINYEARLVEKLKFNDVNSILKLNSQLEHIWKDLKMN